MRIVGRIIAVLWVGLMVSMAGAAIAALNMKKKDYDQAANWLRSSLGKNKQLGDSYLGLADSLSALNQNAEAILDIAG